MSRSQRVLVAVAGVLLLLVVWRFSNFNLPSLFWRPGIARKEAEVQALAQRLEEFERRRERLTRQVGELRRDLAPYLWRLDEKLPASEIQAELERLARRENITIRTMGSPRLADVSEHVKRVEVALNMNGSVREIGRFLGAIEGSDRRFHWVACRLRPINVQGTETINLTGRLEAFYLTPAAEAVLFQER